MMALDNVNSTKASHSEGESTSILRDAADDDDDQLQLPRSLGVACMVQEKEENNKELEDNPEIEQFQDDDAADDSSSAMTDDVVDNITDLKLRILELEGQNQVHEQYIASLEDENSQLNDQIAQLTAQSVLDQQLVSELKQRIENTPLPSKKEDGEDESSSDDDNSQQQQQQQQPPPILSLESDSSVNVGELQTTIEQLQRTVLFLVEEKSNLQITVEELEHQLVQEKGALRNTIEHLDSSNRKNLPLKSIRTKMSKKKQQLKQELRTSMAKKKQELTQELFQSLQLIVPQQSLQPKIVNDKNTTTTEKNLDCSKSRPSVSPSLQINKLFSSTKMIKKKPEPPPPEAAAAAAPQPPQSNNSEDDDSENTNENLDVVELQKLKLFPRKKKESTSQPTPAAPEKTSADPPLVVDENTNQYDMIRETMERKRQSQKVVANFGISAATRKSMTKVHGTGKPINVERYRQKYMKQLQKQEEEDEASESNNDDIFQAPSQEDIERMKNHLDVWDVEGWSADDII